jgi:hypothetical protein
MFSHHTSQLVKTLAAASALAALVAAPAQAEGSHRPYIDGWAFNAVYNGLHRTDGTRFVTDHGAGQNGTGSPRAARPYIDGWAFNATSDAAHRPPPVRVVTDNGFGQDAGLQLAAPPTAVFDWRAASLGALLGAVAVAAAVAAAVVGARRSRTRLVAS